jgi:deoxyribonuclease V
VDVPYLSTGAARAAAVLAADTAFAHVPTGRTAAVPRVAPCRPGQSHLREFPPLRAVPPGLSGLGLLAAGGYAGLDPDGRPGPGAHVHAGSGIPVTGAARSRFRTATHAVPVQRGTSVSPLSATAAGIPAAHAADFGPAHGRQVLAVPLCRADTLMRAGPIAAIMTSCCHPR